jgi:hypothetical protein
MCHVLAYDSLFYVRDSWKIELFRPPISHLCASMASPGAYEFSSYDSLSPFLIENPPASMASICDYETVPAKLSSLWPPFSTIKLFLPMILCQFPWLSQSPSHSSLLWPAHSECAATVIANDSLPVPLALVVFVPTLAGLPSVQSPQLAQCTPVFTVYRVPCPGLWFSAINPESIKQLPVVSGLCSPSTSGLIKLLD